MADWSRTLVLSSAYDASSMSIAHLVAPSYRQFPPSFLRFYLQSQTKIEPRTIFYVICFDLICRDASLHTFSGWWCVLRTPIHSLSVNEAGYIYSHRFVWFQHAADGIQRINVRSSLKHEEIQPSITLKHIVVPLRYSHLTLVEMSFSCCLTLHVLYICLRTCT